MVKTGRQLRYEWQREIRRYRLGQPTKSVAQHLALYADADGMNVRPGVAQLAAECELGESTVRKALKELERIKVIVLVHGGSDFGRRAVASEYRLVLPDDLADRLELVERKPTKAPTRKTKVPGSLLPGGGDVTGTPPPQSGDPDRKTATTEQNTATTEQNTATRWRLHIQDTPSGEERTCADPATAGEYDDELQAVPDTRPAPLEEDSPDRAPTAPALCTARGHKGCGWLSVRDCLDCLSADDLADRLAEIESDPSLSHRGVTR